MSGVQHSKAGFELPVEGLPLFDAVQKDSSTGEDTISETRSTTESLLRSHYFDEPIPLESTYSNSQMREDKSGILFLGVVLDSSGNKGFAIEVDHSYIKNISRPYIKKWKEKGTSGERAMFNYSKNVQEKRQYTVFSTWWKGETRCMINAYNGKVKKSNSKQADLLKTEALRPAVEEMIAIASEKGLL